MVSRDGDAGASMSLKVISKLGEELSNLWSYSPGILNTESGREGASKGLNLAGWTRPTMIRLRSRRTWRALDDVQTAHVAAVGIAAAGEVADVAGIAGESGVEKVSVERDDDVGFREIVARLDGLSESELRAF